MDIEVPLDAREREFVEARIRAGHAASEGEVLREALRCLMERETDERRAYEEWRERTRLEIDQAYEESFHEDGFDGPTVMEELRVKLEARRSGST